MALTFRSSIAANGAALTPTTLTPTLPAGWVANDLVYFCIMLGANVTGLNTPAGWTVRNDLNSDSTGRSILAYRTMVTGDTAPVFTWTTAAKWSYAGICVQPAAGQQAVHSGTPGFLASATGTSHTTPAYAAGTAAGMSILMNGYRGGSNVATAITTTPPANWTEPATNADTSTATGTTAALRQVASWFSYRTGQTGTITPAAYTSSITALSNKYHVFAVEQPVLTWLPVAPYVVGHVAIQTASTW